MNRVELLFALPLCLAVLGLTLLMTQQADGQTRPSGPDDPDAAPKGWAAPKIPGSVRTEFDLPYAGTTNHRQQLDLYLPKSPKDDQPLPLIVFIHGGAWVVGDKRITGGPTGLQLMMSLVAGGEYAGASIEYRNSSEALWPAQINDCKAAIRWLRASAPKYHLNPDRFAALGTSAGGHLAAMLGTSGGVAALEGKLGDHLDVSSKVNCVVDQFGPVDLLALYGGYSMGTGSPEAKLIGGAIGENVEAARSASPITYVAADNPPFLIVHGTSNPGVNISQSEHLYAALKKAGVDATFIHVIGGGHGNFAAGTPEVNKRIRLFLDKYLRDQKVTISDQSIESGVTGTHPGGPPAP